MGIFGFGKSENLYFPGCYSSAFLNNKIENYRKILKKLDIDFKIQKSSDFKCCGGFLDEAGYEKELRKTAKTNNEDFVSSGFKKIITNCPLCYNTLKNYSSLVPEFNIKVEFILITILEKLRQNKNLVKNFFADSIAYYDSCYLSRYNNLSDSARELLSILGYKTIELPYNREETLCCGSCGGLSITNKELSDKIAVRFIKMLSQKKIKRLVTADPRAYIHLKENLEKLNLSKEIEIVEFSEIIAEGIGIKKE
jgi:Fe-S oxidoreductase